MAYQCESISASNVCTAWVQGLTLSDLAITGEQASLIISAVCSYYLVMWLLKKARHSFK